MIVSIHQPNWMPWLGFWNKLWQSDKMILLDSVQYTRGSYINRVELINKASGTFWWTIPVKAELKDNINESKIDNPSKIKKKLWNQIENVYKNTKKWSEVKPILLGTIFHNTDSLSIFNINALFTIAKLFGVENKFVLQSQLNVSDLKKNEMLSDLCNQLGADTYLSGNFAVRYFDKEPFESLNIGVEWQKYKSPNSFSIVHTLCNYGIEETKEMIMG